MINILTNKYQTPITDELLNSLNAEVKDQFLEIVNSVQFIKNLIDPNREYAKDRPKDSKGRIIVDITKPHILENMDYFTPSANYFKKYGVYTKLKPNANPNSEFGKWIREERNRCWEGYVRPSDGEWIPGNLYFYMNYSPIMLSKIRKGTKQADRVKDFPEMWEGIYLRFHYMYQARNGGLYNEFKGGNHGAELAARGKSKSFSMAAILSHNFILGENSTAFSDTVSVVTATNKEYLIKDGVISKFIDTINFCAEHTQFPRKRIKSSLQDMTWKMGYRDTELDIEKGSLNTVIAVSSNDDSSKLRGKRAAFIGIEEFGNFPKLLDLYNILLPSVQDGEYIFGLLYLQGTSGEKSSDFAGAQEIMYNPKGYNMYALPNVYDKYNQGKSYFTYFFPGYLNRKGCYDINGVSDVIASVIEILNNRRQVKYNSSDPNTVVRTIAEIPITPAEAIVKTSFNMFPITALTERLTQLDENPREYDDVFIGNLIINKQGEVEFTPTNSVVIRDFPHKNNKVEGAIEIFKMPERDKSNMVYNNRYILSNDPYDDDVSNTLSLGSIFVLDLWTDKIVAEYTGRPSFAEDFYELSRLLCLFYNGRMNYESNKKGIFAHFSKMNSLYLLTDVLEFLKDKDMIKGTLYGNKSKGTIANTPINNYARNLVRAWLLKPTTIIVNVDNEDKEVTVPNLYNIRNRALLKELISYNTEGNFDRISSVGMLMLLREDRMILCGGNRDSLKKDIDNDYLGKDPFFEANYDKKFMYMSK